MRTCVPLVLGFALAASAQTPQAGAGANFYSREKEVALGAQMARQVRNTVKLVDNPDALRFVEAMGAKLAASLPEPRFDYTFAMIATGANNSDEIIALPGGYIFVPDSLFCQAQDDSEFAGMLAHAMAHVAARHATRTATNSQIGQLATIPLIFNGGFAAYGALQSAGVLLPVSMVRFSRMYEQEADTMAVNMTAAAGYDPEGLLRYVSQQPASASDLVPRDQRFAGLREAVESLRHPPSSEFLQIQKELQNPPRN